MQRRAIYVDHTHCGRHVTGIERITLELFSREALAPLTVTPIAAASRAAMMAAQTCRLPWRAARDRTALFLTPGFPPSPALTLFGARVLPYIHDLFLITRPQDLNARAKAYMARPFRFAVRRLPRFLVNSEHTSRELARFCRAGAEITLYRPQVRDVFGLAGSPCGRAREKGALRLIALGTVEPRKNLRAAAAVLAALRAGAFPRATLDICGRDGWGEDAAALERAPGVTLHGYQPVARIRELTAAADAFITTAHDEGLGLPLLEAQYAGLPVIAPDRPVFREVLAQSGVLIDAADSGAAAARITAYVSAADWRARAAAEAEENLARWNGAAARDHGAVIALLTRLSG